MLSVTLPDGTQREYPSAVTPYDIAAEIGAGLAKAAIAAEVDGAQIDLSTPLPADGSISLRLLTKRDPESLDILRHSCCACDGPGRDAATRRGAASVWPLHQQRFLLRHAAPGTAF